MDKKSKHKIAAELERIFQSGRVPTKYQAILTHFYEGVKNALIEAHRPLEPFLKAFTFFLELVEGQFEEPFQFQPYHKKIREPIDYYRFSLDFIRPLIDCEHSKVFHPEVATEIEERLKKGENAILLANHQTETDPQAIAILLESTHPFLAENIIYVAGERVVTDPLAIPFSMGCDLLCIYSKRYIDHPPELKAKKQLHNKHTMEKMSRLLAEGGKAIYVAPSGGRDRRDADGVVEIAPFDPQSLEMFSLMARKSKTPTKFYPFTLATYELMPPPEIVQRELGELRIAKYTPIYISFAPQFDMDDFVGSAEQDKVLRRGHRADALWKIVHDEYQRIKGQE
jgi:glycerol-3-phosphate O-acyltransferase